MKKIRDHQSKPSIPVKLKTKYDSFNQLWFKQDDTFDLPVITIRGKIMTDSCNIPFTLESYVYANLWLSC